MQVHEISVCLLVTGGPIKGTSMYETHGNHYYGDLAKQWLLRGTTCPMSFTYFDVRELEFPSIDHFFDIYLITGSPCGVYEDIPWIRQLEEYIRKLDLLKRNMIGICFGHQVIAQALGGDVQVNPKGWEISTCTFQLTQEAEALFHGKKDIRLLYFHQDVALKIPDSLTNLGSNELTDFQGTFKERHIITFQGHPEFNTTVMIPLIERGHQNGHFSDDVYQDALKRLEIENDNDYLAKAVFDFFNI